VSFLLLVLGVFAKRLCGDKSKKVHLLL